MNLRWGLAFVSLATVAAPTCAASPARGDATINDATRLRIARAAESAGQSDVAISIYAAAAADRPEDADVQLRYVHALVEADMLREAEEAINQAIERLPGNAALLAERGRVQLKLGNGFSAQSDFDAVLAGNPDHPRALAGKGIALSLQGNSREAVGWLARAHMTSPDDPAISNNLAIALTLAGRLNEADQILQKLVAGGRVSDRTFNNLALVRAALGNSLSSGALLRSPISSDDFSRYVKAVREQAARSIEPAGADR